MAKENESTIADAAGPTGPESPVNSPAEVPVLSGYGISAALDVVVRYLREQYIVDGCRTERVFGCASCEAIDLEQRLIALGREIMEDPRQHAGMVPLTPVPR